MSIWDFFFTSHIFSRSTPWSCYRIVEGSLDNHYNVITLLWKCQEQNFQKILILLNRSPENTRNKKIHLKWTSEHKLMNILIHNVGLISIKSSCITVETPSQCRHRIATVPLQDRYSITRARLQDRYSTVLWSLQYRYRIVGVSLKYLCRIIVVSAPIF